MFLISSIFALGAAVISIIYGLILYRIVLKKPDGNKKIVDIAKAIRGETTAFLKGLHLASAAAMAIVLVLILYSFGWKMALGYIVGLVFTAAASFISVKISSATLSRATEALRLELKGSFNIGFKSSLAGSLIATGLGLLAISGLYLIFRDTENLIGLALGATLFTLFARLSGTTFTKATSITDSESEAAISLSDPHNSALIVKNTGEVIGNNSGSTSEIFSVFSASAIVVILLGQTVFNDQQNAVVFPLVLIAAGTLLAIISSFMTFLWRKSTNVLGAFYRGLAVNAVFAAVAFFFVTKWLTKDNGVHPSINLFLSSISGLMIVFALTLVSRYFASRRIDAAYCFSASMRSALFPAVVIAAAIAGVYSVAGFYGLAVALVGAVSIFPMMNASNTFGTISVGAVAIAKAANTSFEAQNQIGALIPARDSLRAMTNAVIAVTSFLATIVLFYYFSVRLTASVSAASFDLRDPYILAGLVLGGILPYYIAAFVAQSAKGAALGVEEAAKKQLKSTKVMQGLMLYNHRKVSESASKPAFISAYLPLALCVLAPLFIGFVLSTSVLNGFLTGATIVGIFLAISMILGEIIFINAKKAEEDFVNNAAGLAIPSALVSTIIVATLTAVLLPKYSLNDTGKIVVISLVVIAIAALILFKPNNDKK